MERTEKLFAARLLLKETDRAERSGGALGGASGIRGLPPDEAGGEGAELARRAAREIGRRHGASEGGRRRAIRAARVQAERWRREVIAEGPSWTLGPRETETLIRGMDVLDRYGAEGAYELAGGTSLAVRWRHRGSTDFDLEADIGVRWKLIGNLEAMKEAFRHAFPGREVLASVTSIVVGQGEDGVWSFWARSGRLGRTEHKSSVEVAPGRTVTLADPVEVLAGKVEGRMVKQGRFLQRDLYDVAAARTYDPASLATVLAMIGSEDTARVGKDLRVLERTGWWERGEKGRALLDRQGPPDLRVDPKKCLSQSAAILETGAAGLPARGGASRPGTG